MKAATRRKLIKAINALLPLIEKCGGRGGKPGPCPTGVSKSKAIIEASKAVGKPLMDALKKRGIVIEETDRSDVGERGGAAFDRSKGKILVTKKSSASDVIHEIGHAVDTALVSSKKHQDKTFDEKFEDWSSRGLKSALQADKKKGKPEGPSWEDPVRSWQYAFSSSREAFAHCFSAAHGDDTKTNGFSIQQAMPATFAEVSLFIKKLKNSKSV